MNCLGQEKNELIEHSIIKDIRNHFWLKNEIKEIDDPIIKGIIKFFRLKKENEVIKDRIIRNVRSLLEHEEENYYKSLRVGDSWNNNYIEYESNGDRNKILFIEE